MQVNIERMPHGLFRRLSADPLLLFAFAFAFLLAIGIAILSTIIQLETLAIAVLTAFWAIALILILFLYAYSRALTLVNPLRQLSMLIQATHRELQDWDKRARRLSSLLEPEENANPSSPDANFSHDMNRTAFFQINSYWTDGAKRAIRHAMSFARRYSENGDYEVSAAALNAVVAINGLYVKSKGKTFFCNVTFVENPLASDSFINDTMEHLRQQAITAISHRDEQGVEQTLQTMAALVQIYLSIDYSSDLAEKSHAQLASGYLADAVQAVVPHDMADVLMEGQRIMGRIAQSFIAHGHSYDIVSLSEKIAFVACTGCVNEKYRPVTLEGMNQLTILTYDSILHVKNHDIRFAVEKVRRDAALVVRSFLNLPDTPTSNIHSTYLSPYYSSTSAKGLRARLSNLVDAICEAQPENSDANAVIQNLERWSSDLRSTEKELLVTAVTARSQFTLEMIHWITGITDILLSVSNAPACNDHIRKEIRRHAHLLIATLTWIPDDQETIEFVECFQLTEAMFKAAIAAHIRGCNEIANEIAKYLLSWTFKGGRFATRRRILETGLCACAVLALKGGEAQVAALTTSIKSRVSGETALALEIRDGAARWIRERADRLKTQAERTSPFAAIDLELIRENPESICPLLHEVADILCPHGIP